MVARIRTVSARAIAHRKAYGNKTTPSTADYARRLISPLWDGLPVWIQALSWRSKLALTSFQVDIIALTTTGRPSASGPFSLRSQAPDDVTVNQANEDYLFIKLLREDESANFSLNDITEEPRQSPYLQYAPRKEAVAKYFNGYYANHPLAPLVINDKLFLQDLENSSDDILTNVIVGSAIAVSLDVTVVWTKLTLPSSEHLVLEAPLATTAILAKFSSNTFKINSFPGLSSNVSQWQHARHCYSGARMSSRTCASGGRPRCGRRQRSYFGSASAASRRKRRRIWLVKPCLDCQPSRHNPASHGAKLSNMN